MNHTAPRSLAAALSSALLLLPAAAHAEKVVTDDAVADVVIVTGEGDIEDAVPAPENVGSDVVRTSVAHGDHRLRIVVGFRALTRDPLQGTIVRLKTPRARFDILVERLGGAPTATFEGRRYELACDALKAKVDLRADVVTVGLPTTCLDEPRWVRVGVGVLEVAEAPDMDDALSVFADDAHLAAEIGDDLVLGPKVRRG